jgi:hypothetical protein
LSKDLGTLRKIICFKQWNLLSSTWQLIPITTNGHRGKIIIFHTQAKILVTSPKTVSSYLKKACSIYTFVSEPYIFFVKQLGVTLLISQSCKLV